MKILVLFFLLMFPFLAFADENVSGIMGLVAWITDFFATIKEFIFDYTPSLFTQFRIYITTWLLMLKFYFMFESLQFAHAVAMSFLEMIDLTSFINSAISALPQDMKQIASDIKFFQALTLVIEAWITRIVYSSF